MRTKLGLIVHQSVNKELVHTYMDHGDYILFLRSIEPFISSTEGELQNLKSKHEQTRAKLKAAIATIEKKECSEEDQNILESALKLYTNPRYKKAGIAFELSQMVDFFWHGDQRTQSGQQLDNTRKIHIAPWRHSHPLESRNFSNFKGLQTSIKAPAGSIT